MGAINRPDWPRFMKRGTAAAYCDITPVEFDREVIAGRLPSPVSLGNHAHWSRTSLDESLADLAGEGVHDWRKAQKAYAA
jgi:hypothetical protein